MRLKPLAMAQAAVLPLLLLLLCADPTAAQAASASIPYAPMVIVALILALMGAALLVVFIVICHFAWIRQAASTRRTRQPQAPQPQPSTVPKGSTVVEAPLKQEPLQSKSQPKQPDPRESNVYINAAIQEPVVEVVKVPAIRSQPMRPPQTGMRDTASQFLEFLSRKWNMQQPGQQHHPAPTGQQKQQSPKMTTFKPSTTSVKAVTTPSSSVASPEQIQPTWPQLGDAFFDVCEQDVGQYDNVKTLSMVRGGGEADRYEVAMELRDTRRSRASTPGISGRVSEAESDDQQQGVTEPGLQQQQQQEAHDGTGQYVDWFEEVSEAL